MEGGSGKMKLYPIKITMDDSWQLGPECGDILTEERAEETWEWSWFPITNGQI